MPTSCAGFGCTSRSGKDRVSFYRFPKEPERRAAWIRASKRKNFVPGNGSRICSRHFITGKPSNNKENPDWIPSVFNFPSSLGGKSDSARLKAVERAERAAQKKSSKREQQLDAGQLSSHAANENVLQESGQLDAAQALLDLAQPQMKDMACNTEDDYEAHHSKVVCSLLTRIEELESNVEALTKENAGLRAQNGVMSFESVKDEAEQFKFYSGFPSLAIFMWFVRLLTMGTSLCQMSGHSIHNMVLMVMMKLRLGTTNQDIAFRFGLSPVAVSNMISETLPVMACLCKKLIIWPSKETVQGNLPLCFRYPELKNVRVVVDCFEIFTDRPKHLLCRKKTFSSYKHHNTCKILIGVSPAGAVTYLSPVWGGRASDKKITLSSDMIDLLDPYDVVLADRGFMVSTELALYNIKVLMPSFVRGKSQLPRADVERSRLLSRARIHVERVIGRMRTKFRILKITLPVTMYRHVDDVVTICAGVTNLHQSVVP